MAKYSINDTSLIAIGDAVRDKSGKHTRIEPRPKEVEIFKSPNVNSFEDVVNYDTTQRTGSEGPNPITTSFTFSGATKITVKVAINNYLFGTSTVRYKIGIPGETHWRFVAYSEDVNGQINTYEIPGDIVNIELQNIALTGKRNSFYFEVRGYDEDGNLIKDENTLVDTEVLNTLTPAQMAEEIEALSVFDPPAEAFNLMGTCDYAFAYNRWNWFIEHFGNQIMVSNANSIGYMFYNSTELEEISFDIYMASTTSTSHSNGSCFYNCSKLKKAPNIYNFKPGAMGSFFAYCRSLRELPENIVDWDMSYLNGASASLAAVFQNCSSLRKIPSAFLRKMRNMSTSAYSSPYYNFNSIHTLDELIGMPVSLASFTSNTFTYFNQLSRVTDIIFDTNEDGSPIEVTWKNQAINLVDGVGFHNWTNNDYILNYNSGITADKEVVDDATYQALKNDPDWFTRDYNYSRYNHDSAVNTINSLPDVSSGSGNSITFRGASGALTDGGAINTLTEEEIAVAAAKGWTVTLS